MLCVAMSLASSCACAAETVSLEYAIKATYLYKLAPFVAWPDSAFPSPDSPLTICVSGRDPFGQMLDRSAAGQRVGTRPIVIRHLPVITAASGCQEVYLGGSADQPVAQGLELLRGQSVLTVSDSANGTADRGIVNLVIDDNKVRFEIDERGAEQSHLAISSKLLSLARQPPKPK